PRRPTRAPARRWPLSGASPNSRTATAGTPRRSSRPPPAANSRRCWWRAWRSPTCPTRPAPVRRSPRPGSWSPWSCGPARSPSSPTWSCRSPRSPRRPAPSSTGKAGCGCSRRRSSRTR
ncbi:hypothetical protein STREPTOSP366_39030, partial [Streptomyces variabilis]